MRRNLYSASTWKFCQIWNFKAQYVNEFTVSSGEPFLAKEKSYPSTSSLKWKWMLFGVSCNNVNILGNVRRMIQSRNGLIISLDSFGVPCFCQSDAGSNFTFRWSKFINIDLRVIDVTKKAQCQNYNLFLKKKWNLPMKKILT